MSTIFVFLQNNAGPYLPIFWIQKSITLPAKKRSHQNKPKHFHLLPAHHGLRFIIVQCLKKDQPADAACDSSLLCQLNRLNVVIPANKPQKAEPTPNNEIPEAVISKVIIAASLSFS